MLHENNFTVLGGEVEALFENNEPETILENCL